MSFNYEGRHYRRSTETRDGKLAQRIYDKVKGQAEEVALAGVDSG